MKAWVLALVVGLATAVAHAGATHEYAEIDTCYHWLEKYQLDSKIAFAKTHNGDFYFYGPQPGYCWRSPLGSFKAWEDHGDYLVRIKFKPGTRVLGHARSADSHAAMIAPVYYSNDNAWHEYTFTPAAIESWSVYRPETTIEMKAEIRFYEAGLVTANDVFYPFVHFNLNFMKTNTENAISINDTGLKDGFAQIFGVHPERHFATAFPQPWSKFLVRGPNMRVIELPKIKVVSASFGLNLGAAQKGNATAKVSEYCSGKVECTYAINVRYLGINPEPGQEKSFDVAYTCGNSARILKVAVPAPTIGKSAALSCAQ